MYDRAPRAMDFPSGSTTETVGPGTYDSDNVTLHLAKYRTGNFIQL